MKRSTSALLVLVMSAWFSNSVLQAQDKVHVVGKDGLKIEAQLSDMDPKIKIKPIPNKDFSVDLPGKTFVVKLTGGSRYKIDLVSPDKQVDTVMVVQDSAGNQLAFDDDGGEGLNSRLIFQAPKDGDYKIGACTLKGSGMVVLTFTGAGAAKTLDIGPNGAEAVGQLSNDVKAVIYQVKLSEGKTYIIDLMAANQKELDPLLKLIDASGKVVAIDDDGGEGLNSRITFKAPATANYQIEATRLQGQGQFTLKIRAQ